MDGYSDSDWGGDYSSGRSTTGYIFFYGGGPIAWMSKRQTCVALSFMKAEYNALAITCQEAVWLRHLLTDLDELPDGPTTINEDNQSCLNFVKVERASGRVKHTDTKEHFIRELCSRNQIKLQYCSTAEMVADSLTKPLGASKLAALVNRIGLLA